MKLLGSLSKIPNFVTSSIFIALCAVLLGCASIETALSFDSVYNQYRLTVLENNSSGYNAFLGSWRSYNKRAEQVVFHNGLPDFIFPVEKNCVYFAYCNPERYIMSCRSGHRAIDKTLAPDRLLRVVKERSDKIAQRNKQREEEVLRANNEYRECLINVIRNEIASVEAGKQKVPSGMDRGEYVSCLRQATIKRNADCLDGIVNALYRGKCRYEVLSAIIRIRCAISPYDGGCNLKAANTAIGIALENKDISMAKSLVATMRNGRVDCLTFALKKAVDLREDCFVREMISTGMEYDLREVYHALIVSKRYNSLVRSLVKDCYFDSGYWDNLKIKGTTDDDRRYQAAKRYNDKQFWLHEYHMPQGSISISFIDDLMYNEELFCHYISIPLIQSYFVRICVKGRPREFIGKCISGGNIAALKTIYEQSDCQFTYGDVQVAIASGNLGVLTFLRNAGVAFSCSSETVYKAAKIGDRGYFGRLGEFGINVNTVSEIGRYIDRHSVSTPIQGNAISVAVRERDMATAKFLVDNGVDVNPVYGVTPLAYAFDRGDYLAMEALLDCGANPNCNLKGFSLLTLAVAGNKTKAVDMLMSHGAKVNEEKRLCKEKEVFAVEGNNFGYRESTTGSISPLVAAVVSKNQCLSLSLLENGANPNELLSSGTGGVAMTINQMSAMWAIASPAEKTIDILTIAIAYGMPEVAHKMIEKGANVNGNGNAIPPLAWALCIGDFKTAELLVSKGARLDFKIGELSIRAIDAKIKIPSELRNKLGLN